MTLAEGPNPAWWRLLAPTLCLAATVAAAEGDAAAFVQELRERRLDRLAEVWIQQELAGREVSSRRSAELVGLLSQVMVDRALAAAPAQRPAAWRRADAVVDDFLRRQSPRPEWVLLRLQQALNALARGEAESLEAAGRGAATSGAAGGALRAASHRLEAVAEAIEQQRQQAASGEETLPERQLASLANRVALERAVALKRIAESYPAGSPDRDDALLRAAEESLRLASRSLPEGLLWRARLTAIECQRLLNRTEAARARLAGWAAAGPPPEQERGRYLAERWRLLRETGGRDDAERWMASLGAGDRGRPEVRLAVLEAAVARWRRARAGPEKEKLLASIQSAVAGLRATAGPLWGLRAEAVAGGALAASIEGGSVDGLVASAEYLFRSQRLAKAIDAYDRAAGVAYREGARGRAFELALAAAAICQTQEQWGVAAERFRRAALASVTHPDAAGAHRSAAVCLSQSLRQAPAADEGAWREYFALLEEHLTTFPGSPTAREVRWWLIEPLVARGEWEAAIRILAETPADDPRHGRAVVLLADAWSMLAARHQANGDGAAARDAVRRATTELQPIITGADNRWPAAWSDTQRQTALSLARLRLRHDPSGGDYATQLLTAAASDSAGASESWRRSAAALQATAAAHAGRLGAADAHLRVATPTDRNDATLLLDALAGVPDDEAGQSREAGRLMLLVLDGLPPEESTEGPSPRNSDWRLPYRAAALRAVGRAGDALAAARRLAAEQPDNADAQVALAEQLAGQPGEADRRAALDKWRSVENRSAGGTPRWFRARLARIQLLASLGQKQQATKLFKLTKVLHPGLGGMAKEFEAALPGGAP